MMKKFPFSDQSGQTIIELLIATAVIGSVVTAVAIGLTYNIKNNAEVQYREAATTFSHQAIERIRRERESGGWAALTEAFDNGQTYCMSDLNTWPSPAGACGVGDFFEHGRTDFKRELLVNFSDSGSTIDLTASVYWHAGTADETSVSVHHRMKDRLN